MIPCAYPAIQYIMRWQKYPITSDLPVLGLHLFLVNLFTKFLLFVQKSQHLYINLFHIL